MSIMPEPNKSDERINDNADYRDGYAEGFLDGVTGKVAATERPSDGCPEWCTIDHSDEDPNDPVTGGTALHMGDNHVDGTVQALFNLSFGEKLDIRLARCDGEGGPGAPNVLVRTELELKTWEQAAELARTILDAFGYLKGA